VAAVTSKRRASVYTGVSWLAGQHSASKAGLGSVEMIRVFVHYYNGDSVVCCAVLVGNVSWMLFQEGRSSNLRLRRRAGQAARARNNPHVKCNGVFPLLFPTWCTILSILQTIYASTCFGRHPPIFRRSLLLIIQLCRLWCSHSLQVAVLCTCWRESSFNKCTRRLPAENDNTRGYIIV
jgi:hypothetical protein